MLATTYLDIKAATFHFSSSLFHADVMECNGTIALCGDNQKCVNTDGSYMCLNCKYTARKVHDTAIDIPQF